MFCGLFSELLIFRITSLVYLIEGAIVMNNSLEILLSIHVKSTNPFVSLFISSTRTTALRRTWGQVKAVNTMSQNHLDSRHQMIPHKFCYIIQVYTAVFSCDRQLKNVTLVDHHAYLFPHLFQALTPSQAIWCRILQVRPEYLTYSDLICIFMRTSKGLRKDNPNQEYTQIYTTRRPILQEFNGLNMVCEICSSEERVNCDWKYKPQKPPPDVSQLYYLQAGVIKWRVAWTIRTHPSRIDMRCVCPHS